MRRRSAMLVAGMVLSAAALLSACSESGTGDEAAQPETGGATSQLATRSVTAGAVDVEAKPTRLDSGGAAFDLTFDTHSIELDMDLTKVARLTVGGTTWSGATWKGAAPGGHQREGTLSFDPGGPASRKAVLVIEGLPAPVEMSWDLGAGSQ